MTRFSFTMTDEKNAQKKLAGESRKKDGTHYLKLDEAGGIAEAGALQLQGKWIKTKRPFLRWLFPPTDKAAASRQVGADGIGAMKQAVSRQSLFRVLETVPQEADAKDAEYHYKVKLDQDAVIALLLKWRELQTGAAATSDDLVAASLEAATWGEPIGDVRIGKKDRRFRSIELTSAISGDPGETNIKAKIVFSRYGEPVSVEMPEAQDLDKILGDAVKGRLHLAGDRSFEAPAPEAIASATEPAPSAAAPANEDFDGDGFANGQEFFYGADAWNPDTDGDGYPDGQEFDHGMNPVGPGLLFSFGLGA